MYMDPNPERAIKLEEGGVSSGALVRWTENGWLVSWVMIMLPRNKRDKL
jgi:hypothetical protein